MLLILYIFFSYGILSDDSGLVNNLSPQIENPSISSDSEYENLSSPELVSPTYSENDSEFTFSSESDSLNHENNSNDNLYGNGEDEGIIADDDRYLCGTLVKGFPFHLLSFNSASWIVEIKDHLPNESWYV